MTEISPLRFLTASDIKQLAHAIGKTPLMVPGTLRDLLCATTYANDHVIELLLQDVVRTAITALREMR